MVLSTRASHLPKLLGQAWEQYSLSKGWSGLILCMLWEKSRGTVSKWYGYLDSLPTNFDTPMFWTEHDIEELRGTAVIDKIGKDDAERDYLQKVVPCIKSRPDIFTSASLDADYNVQKYHLMGSLILSRGFQLEEQEFAENGNAQPEESHDGAQELNVEEIGSSATDIPNDAVVDESSDDEDDAEFEVAMVPMADMLNARFRSANPQAKLFYEEDKLGMTAIKAITAGEQIWNTYGDPPNSELLRKYGHVDLVALLDGSFGNPADIVELSADSILDAGGLVLDDMKDRIEWWLGEGGDDVFILETSLEVPDALVSFVRLVNLTSMEWQDTSRRKKLLKPKMDENMSHKIQLILHRRLNLYPTTLEDDVRLLTALSEQSSGVVGSSKNRQICALHVRVGEKRILLEMTKMLSTYHQQTADKQKRKPDSSDSPHPLKKQRH